MLDYSIELLVLMEGVRGAQSTDFEVGGFQGVLADLHGI